MEEMRGTEDEGSLFFVSLTDKDFPYLLDNLDRFLKCYGKILRKKYDEESIDRLVDVLEKLNEEM